MKKKLRTQGFSLISILVGLAVLSIGMLIALQFQKFSFSSAIRLEVQSDLTILQEIILTQLDCDGIFTTPTIVDPLDPAVCNTTSAIGGQNGAGKYFGLSRKVEDGTILPLTGSLEADGSGKFMDWNLRTTCSASEKSLIIRAAKKTPTGGFELDKYTQQPLDWVNPKGLIAGATRGGIPVCYFRRPKYISGQLARAYREFTLDRLNNTVTSVVVPIAGSPLSAFLVVDNAPDIPAGERDGIACNTAEDWAAITCMDSSNRAISNETMLGPVTDPTRSFFFEYGTLMSLDRCLIRAHEGALLGLENTEEWLDQNADGILDRDQDLNGDGVPDAAPYKVRVYITCAKLI